MTATTCHWHPDRVTGLHCGNCGRPMCPECMRQHPVGIRCKECAGAARIPTYQVSKGYVARGVAAAVGLGVAGIVGLGALRLVVGPSIGFINLFVMLGLGYVIGEGVGAAVNRRRGRTYQYIAVGGVAIATLPELSFALFELSIAAAFVLAGVGVAAAVAWRRLEP